MADAPTVYTPPVIEHSEWDKTSERLLLFTITTPIVDDHGNQSYDDNGEPMVAETDYSCPRKPHVGLGLTFLRYARVQGVEIAMSWLLEEVIGTEGYDALAAEPDLDSATLRDITLKVRNTVLGGLSGPKE